MRRMTVLFISALFLAALLAGCGKPTAKPTPTPAPTPISTPELTPGEFVPVTEPYLRIEFLEGKAVRLFMGYSWI